MVPSNFPELFFPLTFWVYVTCHHLTQSHPEWTQLEIVINQHDAFPYSISNASYHSIHWILFLARLLLTSSFSLRTDSLARVKFDGWFLATTSLKEWLIHLLCSLFIDKFEALKKLSPYLFFEPQKCPIRSLSYLNRCLNFKTWGFQRGSTVYWYCYMHVKQLTFPTLSDFTCSLLHFLV